MPGGFGTDPRDELKNNTRNKNLEQEKEKEQARQLEQMSIEQMLMQILKKDRDKDRAEKKKLLMALIQKILNSFKKNASSMSESDAADISKAGNKNGSDHGDTAKAK